MKITQINKNLFKYGQWEFFRENGDNGFFPVIRNPNAEKIFPIRNQVYFHNKIPKRIINYIKNRSYFFWEREYTVELANPSNYNLSGNYYSQNILVWQVDFPYKYTEGDFYRCFYSDRIYSLDSEKNMDISHVMIYAPWHGIEPISQDKKVWIQFGNDLLSAMKLNKKCSGIRVMRQTNVSNGYPLYTIEVYKKHPKNKKQEVYTGFFGKNVKKNEIIIRRS